MSKFRGILSIGLALIFGVGCNQSTMFSPFKELNDEFGKGGLPDKFPGLECSPTEVDLQPDLDTQNPIRFNNRNRQKLDVAMTSTVCDWKGSQDDQPRWLNLDPLNGVGKTTIQMNAIDINNEENDLFSNFQLDLEYERLSEVDREGKKFHAVMDSCGLDFQDGSKEIKFDVNGNLVSSPKILFRGSNCNWRIKINYINDTNWIRVADRSFPDSSTSEEIAPSSSESLSSLLAVSGNASGTIGRNAVLQVSSNFTTHAQIPIHQQGPVTSGCQVLNAISKSKITYYPSDTKGEIQVEVAGRNCGWNVGLDSAGANWIALNPDSALSTGKSIIPFTFKSPMNGNRVGQIFVQSDSSNSTGGASSSNYQIQIEQVQTPPCKIVLRNPHPPAYTKAEQYPKNVTVAAQTGDTCKWTLRSPDASDWINNLSLTDGAKMYNRQVVFRLSQNTSGKDRIGHIVISNETEGLGAWNYAITIEQFAGSEPHPSPTPSSTPSNLLSVTPAGTHVTFSPQSSQSVAQGSTTTFHLTAQEGFTLSRDVTGSCPTGGWQNDDYTTGPIHQSCDVNFSAARRTLTVSASGQNIVVQSPVSRTVNYGETATFMVNPNSGYSISVNQIGGTCPAGTWDSTKSPSMYTTGPITQNCDVLFSANSSTLKATSSGQNVSVSPNGAQTVKYNDFISFMVTPNTGYSLEGVVTRDELTPVCPGVLSSTPTKATFLAGPITESCSVVFSGKPLSYHVTAASSEVALSGGLSSSVSINPSSQTIGYGEAATFSVVPNSGFKYPVTVSGGCASTGTLSGSSYTTSPIHKDCALTFTGTVASYQVTASGSNVAISNSGTAPASSVTSSTNYKGTLAFTVTPNSNYILDTQISGTCPTGSWDSLSSPVVYTTGPVTENCTVIFTAHSRPAPEKIVVTASGDQGVSISPIPLTVASGSTATVNPVALKGFQMNTTVGGNCPQGHWNSDGSYTTAQLSPSSVPSPGTSCQVIFTSQPISLSVTLLKSPHVSITGSSANASGLYSVLYKTPITFTITPQQGYLLSNSLHGKTNCPSGSWSGSSYTTGNITQNCQIGFSADPQKFNVKATTSNISVSPTKRRVVYNGTATFHVDTPPMGYSLQPITSSCPLVSNELDDNRNLVTGPITQDCDIHIDATINKYNVSIVAAQDAQVNFPESTTQIITYGQTAKFNGITAKPGYSISVASDTCGGVYKSSTYAYTSGSITKNCVVTFQTQPLSYTVSANPASGASVRVTPQSSTVAYNQTAQFSVTGSPRSNYWVKSVTDSCPNKGFWSYSSEDLSSRIYTTGAITQDCTLTFDTESLGYTVTAVGDNHLSILTGTQKVGDGKRAKFDIQLDPGFQFHSVTDQCANDSKTEGSWEALQTTYTTGRVVKNCTVKFTSSQIPCTCTIAAASGQSSGHCNSNLNNDTYIVGADYKVDSDTSMTIKYIKNREETHTLALCEDAEPVVTISGGLCTYQVQNSSPPCWPNSAQMISNIKLNPDKKNLISNGTTRIPYRYAQWINLFNKNKPFTQINKGITIYPVSGTVGNTCTVYIYGNEAPKKSPAD